MFEAELTALVPFTLKLYVAAPEGNAVNVTALPAHIMLSASLLEIVAVIAGFTVIVIPALVATQPVIEVMVTLTTSLLFRVLVV